MAPGIKLSSGAVWGVLCREGIRLIFSTVREDCSKRKQQQECPLLPGVKDATGSQSGVRGTRMTQPAFVTRHTHPMLCSCPMGWKMFPTLTVTWSPSCSTTGRCFSAAPLSGCRVQDFKGFAGIRRAALGAGERASNTILWFLSVRNTGSFFMKILRSQSSAGRPYGIGPAIFLSFHIIFPKIVHSIHKAFRQTWQEDNLLLTYFLQE